MTVPWTSKDDDHVTSPSLPSISLLDFQDLVDDIKLCFITLDGLVENQPSCQKSLAVVNDIFFDLHSRIVSDSENLNDNCNSATSDSSVKQQKKYTVFIIIVSRYEQVQRKTENSDCRPKVKTCGKHRKLMLKSSFLGLKDDGVRLIYMLNDPK